MSRSPLLYATVLIKDTNLITSRRIAVRRTDETKFYECFKHELSAQAAISFLPDVLE